MQYTDNLVQGFKDISYTGFETRQQALKQGCLIMSIPGTCCKTSAGWYAPCLRLSVPCSAGFPRGSLFHGREVSTHINATWGDHALVDAAKALLKVRIP